DREGGLGPGEAGSTPRRPREDSLCRGLRGPRASLTTPPFGDSSAAAATAEEEGTQRWLTPPPPGAAPSAMLRPRDERSGAGPRRPTQLIGFDSTKKASGDRWQPLGRPRRPLFAVEARRCRQEVRVGGG